jgi:hypothetical protein
MQYVPDVDPASFMNEDVFSTNVDAIHGPDPTGVAALATHPNFFQGLTTQGDEDDEDGDENPNDVLLRLLNEVRAVDSDVDENEGEVIDRNSDENAAGVRFSVTGSSGLKGFAVPYSGVIHSSSTAAAAAANGGFTVEGNASYSSAASLPPPPPPPPPAYGTPSTAPRSPYVNCYSGIPHLTATPGTTKPPPPSFAEAMATSHGTPASLAGRPSPSQERSPVMANYVPAMPTAPQETVLLRNCNGVFLLQPVSKPTPPYTPPAGCNSPPVSPLPRYSLPPAAMAGGCSSTTSNNFLGSSMAQASAPRQATAAAAAVTEPPLYPPYGAAGGSPFLSTAAPFVSAVNSLRGTPSFPAAPPPYGGAR